MWVEQNNNWLKWIGVDSTPGPVPKGYSLLRNKPNFAKPRMKPCTKRSMKRVTDPSCGCSVLHITCNKLNKEVQPKDCMLCEINSP